MIEKGKKLVCSSKECGFVCSMPEDAKEKETDMQIETEVFATLPFSDREIISLFGNVLDNALEACERIQDKKRWIKIKIKRRIIYYILRPQMQLKKCRCRIRRNLISKRR